MTTSTQAVVTLNSVHDWVFTADVGGLVDMGGVCYRVVAKDRDKLTWTLEPDDMASWRLHARRVQFAAAVFG